MRYLIFPFLILIAITTPSLPLGAAQQLDPQHGLMHGREVGDQCKHSDCQKEDYQHKNIGEHVAIVHFEIDKHGPCSWCAKRFQRPRSHFKSCPKAAEMATHIGNHRVLQPQDQAKKSCCMDCGTDHPGEMSDCTPPYDCLCGKSYKNYEGYRNHLSRVSLPAPDHRASEARSNLTYDRVREKSQRFKPREEWDLRPRRFRGRGIEKTGYHYKRDTTCKLPIQGGDAVCEAIIKADSRNKIAFHIASNHSAIPPDLACAVCKGTFLTKSKFARHMAPESHTACFARYTGGPLDTFYNHGDREIKIRVGAPSAALMGMVVTGLINLNP